MLLVATADTGHLHPRPIGGADGVQAAAYASLTLTVPALQLRCKTVIFKITGRSVPVRRRPL